mgnify:CR=1 FL=1
MDFNVNTGARKVAELLEKSKTLRRLAWGLILMTPTTALIWKLADILTALKQAV